MTKNINVNCQQIINRYEQLARFTWEAFVDDFQEDGKPAWTGRLHDVERGLGQLYVTGATTRAQPVSLTDHVGFAADVAAAVLGGHKAPARSHAAVHRTADDDDFVQRARRAKRLPAAVLP